MSFEKQPAPNHGFIYILSNASMPGVYKVGLTTNSVRQRAQELASTGVPTEFRAEKIFEIEDHHLRTIEQRCHITLKNKNYHHGKEFFKAPLSLVVEIVEDTIHEITRQKKPDLIGLAAQRATEREREQTIARLQIEKEMLRKKIDQETSEHTERQTQQRSIFSNNASIEAEKEAFQKIKEITMLETGLKSGEQPLLQSLFLILTYGLGMLVTLPSAGWFTLVWAVCGGIVLVYFAFIKPEKFNKKLSENMSRMPELRLEIYQKKMREYDESMISVNHYPNRKIALEKEFFEKSQALGKLQAGGSRATFSEKILTCPACKNSNIYIVHQRVIKCKTCLISNDISTFSEAVQQ
jgi:hypothetical protein